MPESWVATVKPGKILFEMEGVDEKTARDAFLARLDARFPYYGFARHKGYGTAEHLAALAALGPCPAHRRSFAPVAQAAFGF